VSDLDITRTVEIEAQCPRCRRRQRLPVDWKELMALSAPPGWDGRLRCKDGHEATTMTMTACITCPECKRTSYNPNDVENLYCGYCHWWTSHPELAPNRPE
jgi:hypothetical protein